MWGGMLEELGGVGGVRTDRQELLPASQARRDSVRFIVIDTFHLLIDECFLYQIYCGEQMKIYAIGKE